MALEEMAHRSRLGLLLTMTEGRILRFEPDIPFLVGGHHRKVRATTRGVGVQICPGGGRGVDIRFLAKIECVGRVAILSRLALA